MILLFSVVSIFVLFALKYFIDKKDNANIFNDMRNNADNEDGNIYTYVKGINSHLETILYEIDNEILYLKGKYTEKNVQNKYYKHIETKYIPIDTENN